jgi:hypothetical protein
VGDDLHPRQRGCPTPIPAIVWHEGDRQQQVGLLTNVDHLYPGRWTAPELITLLRGRWAQENAFKAMRQKTDGHWTGGYVHEPAAETPVPNPRTKRWHQRLAFRTAQLRRAMDRLDAARDPRAERAWHRRVVALQAQVRRLQRQLARTPATVPYGSVGHRATTALHRGRGLLGPVLRAAAYHIRLLLRDAIARFLPDHREWDKALRGLLHTPGVYRAGAGGDWVVLQRPQLPHRARVLSGWWTWSTPTRPTPGAAPAPDTPPASPWTPPDPMGLPPCTTPRPAPGAKGTDL